MKYKTRNYFQVSNEIIDFFKERKITPSTKWLFVVLCHLEHRFTGQKIDYFFRSIKELEKDSGLSGKTIVNSIKKLKDLGLIETWQAHWIDKETGKKSEKHITGFRIDEI